MDLTLKNNKGFNIFHAAVIAGNVPILQLLLDRQESLALERVEGSQCSALHLACIKGDLQVIHLLRERFKERMMVDDVDREGQTALMKACREGHYSLIQFLVEMGADVNKVDLEGSTPISLLIKNLRSHFAPLPDAAIHIHEIFIKLLNEDSETMTEYPSLSAVCYLVKNGGKFNITIQIDDQKKITILEEFVEDSHTAMDDSEEREPVVDEICMLCSRQAITEFFKCCKTTSSLTCAKCCFSVINCPHCGKSLDGVRNRRNQLNFTGTVNELDELNGPKVNAPKLKVLSDFKTHINSLIKLVFVLEGCQ